MEYTKINLHIEPDNEINRELLIAGLGEAGFDSFSETEEFVEAYIPSSQFSEDLLTNEDLTLSRFTFNYIIEIIPDQNWNEVWEKNYFKPLLIENQCLIRAPFHTEYTGAAYEIIIEPKMAFGTGNHETTYLMVSEILNTDMQGKKVLDMGSGTGVLGIFASMRGAAEVTAIDIDQNSFNATIENARLNNISNLSAQLGGSDLLNKGSYDVILANIQRNIILNDLPAYVRVLGKNGVLIVSGFYVEDLPIIQRKALECGLKHLSFNEKNNWVICKFSFE